MALDEVVFQHDHIYSYNYDFEAYNETPFYGLQDSLSYLHNQTQNYESAILLQDQEDYYENAAIFLHQPLPEIVTNEAKMTSSCHWDSEINPTTAKKQATRRRSRVKKNKEEINNQRMTHIAVERNRRKLMNEYLSVLRSLMPDSYIQRCDQASIVGGAINFIRELEHRLHNFSSDEPNESSLSEPFSDIIKLPQFSICSSPVNDHVSLEVNSLADIEVSLFESYASIKIRSRKRPKLLLCIVSSLQSLGFIILHLNVSTASDFIFYCFSTKMEDYCKLTSVADIATAVHEMIKIHHDSQQ